MNLNPGASQALPAIGAPFEGGFYGGCIQLDGALTAVVWAPKALGESTGTWGPRKDVGAWSCCNSAANTLAMAEAGSALARWAQDLRIAGHADWCLPARDVLELAYRHLKPGTEATEAYFRDGDNPSSLPPGYPYANGEPIVQTPVQAFLAGGEEAFEKRWYWSSTQCSASNAWYQDFDDGPQDDSVKSYEARARAVRLIRLVP